MTTTHDERPGDRTRTREAILAYPSQAVGVRTRRSQGRTLASLAFLMSGLSLLFWGSLWLGRPTWGRTGDAIPTREVTARGPLHTDEQETIQLFRAASGSAVNITTFGVRRSWTGRDYQVPLGSGTGIVWDAQGHIVTNFHVIYPGLELARNKRPVAEVTLAGDSRRHAAMLVGIAPLTDLAVLQLVDPPSAGLIPISLGTSDDLQVGQKVLAIGNPFGLDQTLTTGVISALNREIQSVRGTPIKDVIQTDAAINPGNSGGPLLDSAGRLIGLNTAIYSPSGAYAGIGFAIPVDRVAQVVPEIIAFGEPRTPGLGVVITPARPKVGGDGLLVVDVLAGGTADSMGLRSYYQNDGDADVILAIDGAATNTSRDLSRALSDRSVGDQISVKIRRGKETLVLDVKLKEMPRQ